MFPVLKRLLQVLFLFTMLDYLLAITAQVRLALKVPELWIPAFRYMMPNIFSLVSHGLLLMKYESISALGRERCAVEQHLRHQLFRLVLVYVVSFIANTGVSLVYRVYAVQMVVDTTFWWEVGHYKPLEELFGYIHILIFTNAVQKPWALVGMLLYLHCQQRMIKLNTESIARIGCHDKITSKQFKQSLHIMKLVQHRHDDFESIFRVFPLLWFSSIFLTFSCIMLTDILSKGATNVLISMTEFKDILFLLYLIVRIDSEKVALRSAIAQVKQALVQRQGEYDDMKSFFLNMQIQRSLAELNLDHTALHLFQLDRSLIVSFVGALITFGVLFIQLAGVNSYY
ncbi:hypothetical protein HDE_10236 [Halotydeus destructor]|nr:hypothetical protein HDE_10236 [Halotydeus destructor]